MFNILTQKANPVTVFETTYGADFVFKNEETKTTTTFFIINEVLMSFSENTVKDIVNVWIPLGGSEYTFTERMEYSHHNVCCTYAGTMNYFSSSVKPLCIFQINGSNYTYIVNNGNPLVIVDNEYEESIIFLKQQEISSEKFKDLLTVIHSDYNREENYFPTDNLIKIVENLKEFKSPDYEW
jgi:hypothetical protein